MYSLNSTEYQKFSGDSSPPQPVTGIPVSSSPKHYSEAPQKRAPPVKPKPKVAWSTGLFGCFSDVRNCCITCWCPCITFGRIAEMVDKGTSSCGQNGALYALIACVTGCPCCYSCFYRSKMRQQHSLKESPCGDCMVHCCCECCALCQEYRELRNLDWDPSLGWHGNMEKRNPPPTAPVVEEGMSR